MNTIKSLACFLILAASAGCSTLKGPDVDRMATVAYVATVTGAKLDLMDNPGHDIYYKASVDALSNLLNDENYNPAEFIAALQVLPVAELKSDKGSLIVGAAVVLWDSYKQEVVNLDKERYVRPVIVAVRDGLRRALAGVR